ncbi:PEBP-like protein [Zalerion maritima]|uniref:PEBP-like protein n=1 Tax=Zalerion maritima TaxID=339359 RepID=A0AAD5RVT7_9PEZI|nr:PEBP-like protein [Zalerion maritima]
MASTSEDVLNTLKLSNLIPDIFSSPPSAKLQDFTISYPTCEVKLGNELTPELTAAEPSIVFPGAEDGGSYTLAMLDPDAPTRMDPMFRSFRHWVVTGVKKVGGGGKLRLGKNATTPYRPPGPRPNSGVHRYTFILFKEPDAFEVPKDAKEHGAALEERRSWNAMDFAETSGLELFPLSEGATGSTDGKWLLSWHPTRVTGPPVRLAALGEFCENPTGPGLALFDVFGQSLLLPTGAKTPLCCADGIWNAKKEATVTGHPPFLVRQGEHQETSRDPSSRAPIMSQKRRKG